MDNEQNFNRRQLLQGLLSAASATGACMTARPAWALPTMNTLDSVNVSQKRVIFVYVPGGAIPALWAPAGCGSRFSLPPMSAPLEPVKQHCVFFRNVIASDPGHGRIFFALGAQGYDPEESTLDVKIAQQISTHQPFEHLSLAVMPSEWDTMSIRHGMRVPTIDNPLEALHYLTGNAALPSNPLIQAFAKVTDQEISNSFDHQADLMLALTTFACQQELTRVISLQLGGDLGDFTVPESGSPYSYTQGIHGDTQNYIKVRAYLAKKLAYLIQLLKVTPDLDGRPLLESTLVVQVANMADGRFDGAEGTPYLLAGGSNFVRNGLVVDARIQGDVLNTVALAMGVDIDFYNAGAFEEILLQQP